MSKFKLSLAVAVAATSFSALDAKPLEEAIRGVDISGSVRYRYDTFRQNEWQTADYPQYKTADGQPFKLKQRTGDPTQQHEFRANLSTKIHIGDGFSIVGTLDYNTDGEVDNGYNVGEYAKTKLPIYLREAYVRYDSRPEFATAITLGRQQLNTIWTDNDNIGGSAGMKAQLINTALPGATLTAFAVDSVDDDGDFVGTELGANMEDFDYDNSGNLTNPFVAGKYDSLKDAIFSTNIYGAAAIFDYSESSGVTGSVWFGYAQDRLSLYAVDLGYSLGLGEDGSWNLQGQYLGSSPVSYLRSNKEFQDALGGEMASGNLYTITTGIEIVGLDASVGYSHYGRKNRLTVNVLEDMGDIITAGEEIQNLPGMSLHGDIGRNHIVFGSLGYTIMDKFRIGADYAWALSKVVGGTGGDLRDDFGDNNVVDDYGNDRVIKYINQEVVGRLEYAFSDDLNFSAFYSYVTQKPMGYGGSTRIEQNNIRFEARYDF